MLKNDSYLHRQSSVLFACKICFDQIFVVGIFWGAFQQEMQFRPGCFFKVYATHFLIYMWPPLWQNSKLAKSIQLFLNPYPFIQKSLCGYAFVSQELFLSTNLHKWYLYVICYFGLWDALILIVHKHHQCFKMIPIPAPSISSIISF